MNIDALFEACGTGQATRVEELLDSGIDVNVRDFDREDTPLHAAAAKGQKRVMEILVEQGADVNAQNNRGETPLHSLVKKRFDLVALWLVRQGADINLENDKACSARDFALDWFQQELDDAAAGVMPEGALEAKQAVDAERAKHEGGQPQSIAEAAASELSKKPIAGQEVMKIYLRNGSYKTVIVGPLHTCRDLTVLTSKKMGIEDVAAHFDIISANKDDERRLQPNEIIFDVKKKWPLAQQQQCKFIMVLKRGTPAHVVERYRSTLR